MKLIITLQSKIIVSVFAKNTTKDEKTAFGAFTLSFMHTKRSLVWRKSTLSNEAIEGVYISSPYALLYVGSIFEMFKKITDKIKSTSTRQIHFLINFMFKMFTVRKALKANMVYKGKFSVL